MHKAVWIIGLVIVVLIVLGIYFMSGKKTDSTTEKKTEKDNSNLLAGLTGSAGSSDFTPVEATKMLIPSILKNTIMSLKEMISANDFEMFGGPVGPQGNGVVPIQEIRFIGNDIAFVTQDGNHTKAVFYNLATGVKQPGRYYEGSINNPNPTWITGSVDGYNVRTKSGRVLFEVALNMLKQFYPNVIREGLFYIKSNGKYIFKNSTGGLELKNGVADSNTFSNTYQSCTTKIQEEQPMVFYLKLKEKDDLKREYTFYVKNFIGDIASDSAFKNIGIKPFWQAGYNNLEAKFAYGCWEGHEGGFNANILAGQKERNLYSNWAGRHDRSGRNNFPDDAISWYFMPFGLKGNAWWDYFSGNVNVMKTGTTFPADECGKGRFNVVGNDEWSTIKIEYEEPDRSSLSILDSTTDDSSCEFKIKLDNNNKWYIEKDGKYLHFWGWQFPSFVDGFNNRHSIELVPVLSKDMALNYIKASVKVLQEISSTEARRNKLAQFCGSDIKFPDGTLKIDVGSAENFSSDEVIKAFERICACNMQESFYKEKICSDQFIKESYGVENSPDGTFYDAIRSNLKCTIPNCTFEKCRKVYDLTGAEESKMRLLYGDAPNKTDKCGSSTMCFVNQTINVGGSINSKVNMSASQQCGLSTATGSNILSKYGELEWLSNVQTGGSSGTSQIPIDVTNRSSAIDTLPKDAAGVITINFIPGFSGSHDDFSTTDKNQTPEMCRQKALNSNGKYVAWGHRNENHPDPRYKNTCFLYTKPPFLKPNPKWTPVDDKVHITGCNNPGEVAMFGCKTRNEITQKIQNVKVELFEGENYTQPINQFSPGPPITPNSLSNKKIGSLKIPMGLDVFIITKQRPGLMPDNKVTTNIPSFNSWLASKGSSFTDLLAIEIMPQNDIAYNLF